MIEERVDRTPGRDLPLAPSPDETTEGATEAVMDVLREWRAAERSLAELHPGTDEWAATVRLIGHLRGRYQELFRSAAPREAGDDRLPA